MTGSRSVAIGLLGDVMLGRGVGAELAHRRPNELWDPELRVLMGALDLVACNLECYISVRGEPTALIADKPFFFRAPPAAVDPLRAIGVEAAGLANNHALDFGQAALADTVSALKAAGIIVAGAGLGPAAAREAAIVSTNGRAARPHRKPSFRAARIAHPGSSPRRWRWGAGCGAGSSRAAAVFRRKFFAV